MFIYTYIITNLMFKITNNQEIISFFLELHYQFSYLIIILSSPKPLCGKRLNAFYTVLLHKLYYKTAGLRNNYSFLLDFDDELAQRCLTTMSQHNSRIWYAFVFLIQWSERLYSYIVFSDPRFKSTDISNSGFATLALRFEFDLVKGP